MYSSRQYSRKYPKGYRKYNYNIKDIYSPSLYKATAPNYYQQKGRVIQQSPRIIREPPTELMTVKKLDKMYQKLLKYKYPIPPPPPELKNLSHTFTYPNINLGILEYSFSDSYQYKFQDIWDQVIGDFSDILSIDNLRVQNVFFYVSLVSFAFGGATAAEGYDAEDNHLASFGIDTTDQATQPYDYQFTLNLEQYGGPPNVGFGVLSNNNTIAIGYSGYDGYIQQIFKLGMTNQPFLNMFLRQQVAILTALREKDYDAFNPTLLKWTLLSLDGQETLSMSNHAITIQISLSIDYL